MTFWAKTARGVAADPTAPIRYLPLDRHLDDVGAVAERLWDVALTDRQRVWVAAGLGCSVSLARSWVVFLAAAHDIGKASSPFQRQAPALADQVLPANLRRSGKRAAQLRHDQIGGAILLAWLVERGGEADAAHSLAATISGHHGTLRSRRDLERAAKRVLRESPEWSPWQRGLLDRLATAYSVDAAAITAVAPCGSAVILAIAGFVSVADWIASDERRFPVTDGARSASDVLAESAVRLVAWEPPPRVDSVSFGQLFASGDEERLPRATQAAVMDVVEEANQPMLLIVEDRTGAGKTEAALWVVQDAMRRGARGMYIGMPTRATADQLHDRTARFVDRLWPDAALRPRLLHGGASADGVVPRPTGTDEGVEPGQAANTDDADAQAWFATGRRGLLSPLGVGTVDQVLLGVLTAKHFPVRLWGLQGKVVVFDEIHSYDTYTGLLLERAVEWLAALGCTVVLLSATLPTPRRQELVAAYRRGCGQGHTTFDPDADTGALPYPRLTVATAEQHRVVPITDDRSPRTIEIVHLAVDESVVEGAISEWATAELRDGGCVAVVCSTVDDAQARYRALRARLPADVEVVLLHARMRPVERGPIETAVLARLGPPDALATTRPDRLVVVATQVVEQSLDIDFDVMLTDLVPVDLLVQRAGRVHRHARSDRPARHATPKLVVLDTPGTVSSRPSFAGAEAVYGASLLQRTRLALRGRTRIVEPHDLDALIGAVYDRSLDPGGTPEERDALRAVDARADNKARKLSVWADDAAVVSPHGETPPWGRRRGRIAGSRRARRDRAELGRDPLV